MGRIAARVAVGVGVLVAASIVVLGGEVLLARRGVDLSDREPYDLDGRVGGARDGRVERVVWLGDSTAAGVGASAPDEALPRQVAGLADHPVDLTVLAVSGARVDDVLADQVDDVPVDADTVYVSVGANDTVHLTRAGDFRDRYEQVLAALPDGVDVVLLGVPDMGSTPRFAQPLRFVAGVRGGTIDAVIADLAAAPGRTYVDIAGETGPAFRRDPGELFAADDYHPSDAGYARWATAVDAARRAQEADR
ncbi:MAG: SGNH/GDSL hydrolase family protein [Acidimicrobiales bacterium]|nr:SGNH/GDSL hydrolase family protein [Acidimicrobiales bacterium]